MSITQRQLKMLRTLQTRGYIHVGLSELTDEDYGILTAKGFIREYNGIGASIVSTLTLEGRDFIDNHDNPRAT